jgi:hypothetical protein
MPSKTPTTSADKYEVKPDQSIELLKELHILTRDGKMNQDSRRKLKQVFHLVQFVEPIIQEISSAQGGFQMIDFGAGKSYLGFLLYDLVAKKLPHPFKIIGIDIRKDLVTHSQALAQKLNFSNMEFWHLSAQQALENNLDSSSIHLVTALHACNTATDDAIAFALQNKVPNLVLVPCCQAELASILRQNKSSLLKNQYFSALFKFPIHTREFGSHLTNVLRCLYLESKEYEVTVTELVGWEHSMKNELIIAKKRDHSLLAAKAKEQLKYLLAEFNLSTLYARFEIEP